ncbi:protein bric-a-brac 2-like [Teleopsis dalmanni]|uniref:protein bric-a-brac 2-like n=1 Tax=Teleopsis dalmanni TaxID=139649 RepID=UPI0018CFB222|nr:protein bric-a-brac 2-like [Teleopsis dalmanni]
MDMTKDNIDYVHQADSLNAILPKVSPVIATTTATNDISEVTFKANTATVTPTVSPVSAAATLSPLLPSTGGNAATTSAALETNTAPVRPKSLTPDLMKTFGNITTAGDLTPPPRPLTSSEVVGLTASLDDPDMRVDTPVPKSRSLPASPNHLTSLPHMAALFEFGRDYGVPATHAASLKLPKPTREALHTEKSPSKPKTVPSSNQQFCLRWNNYQTNLTNVFDELLQNESFVDVTLACEGQSIKAHKMVLSACSPYFQALFYDNPCQHPIIIMRDVRWPELKALMEFMYKGEINVRQDQINPLLKVAEMLKIRGLAEVSSGAHGVAAHPMLPEQRMTVYDDEEDDDDINDARHLLTNDDDDDDDEEACHKPKRARILDAALEKLRAPTALELNLSAHHQRKRSRDGALLDDSILRRSRSHTPLPRPTEKQHNAAAAENAPANDAASNTQPIAMTTSTIVRNPFASPNPTTASNNSVTTNTSSTSSSTTSSGTSSSSATSASSAYRPTVGCSSPLPSAHGNSAQRSSPNDNGTPNSANTHSHPAAAAAAAAAALASSHHPHHSHHHLHHPAAAAAQQLAQQQLHAAAHSHAAMSAALGASLAAAAAGSSGGGGSGAGAGAHHEELEIKPEIAEMIREEERF